MICEMSNPEVSYGPERRPWRETVSEVAVTEAGELLVSPPSTDPLQLDSYPEVPGISSTLYQLPSSGLAPEHRQRALQDALTHLSSGSQLFLGSQANLDFSCDSVKDYVSKYFPLTGGDPFVDGPCAQNLKWMERNVLDYFASLWHAKWPHDPLNTDSYWGYVMSVDVTEAAYYSLRNARDYLSGKFIDQAYITTSDSNEIDLREVDIYIQGQYESANTNAYTPVALFSSEAHRSFLKAAHTVGVTTFHDIGVRCYPDECPLGREWPYHVPCEGGDAGPGSVDVWALAMLVDFFSGKGHPVVVLFNYGSCFKGACDDVKKAGETLIPILKKNGMYERTLHLKSAKSDAHVCRKGFWFHVDGVLAAAYMPFLEMAYRKGLTTQPPGPAFDFRLDFVTSLAANCHTWFGSPWPCAVYMTRSGHQLRKTMSHFGFFDSALTGSRYGLSTVLLWAHFSSVDFTKQVQRVVERFAAIQRTEQALKDLELKIGLDLWIRRSPHSIMIYFRQPNDAIVKKYHLAIQTLFVDGQVRDYAGFCHANDQNVKMLLLDLCQPNSFWV